MSQENTNNGKRRSRKGFEILAPGIAKLNEKKVVIISVLAVCAIFSLLFWSLYDQSYTASVLIYPDQLSKTDLISGRDQANADFASYNMPFEVYSTLLRSPEVQMRVLQKNYTLKFNYKSYSIDLVKYFAMKNLSYALRELNDVTEIDYLGNAHILKLSVTTKYPDLSRQIAEAYLTELEKRLDQLRREKISDNVDRLDRALLFIQDYHSITDSDRSDLVSRIEDKKETVMLAAELNPVRLGTIDEGYTQKNIKYSRTALVSIPMILGIAAIMAMFGLEAIKSRKKASPVPVRTNRVSMKRKGETAPSQSRKRPAPKTIKKTSKEKKPQTRRAVKV